MVKGKLFFALGLVVLLALVGYGGWKYYNESYIPSDARYKPLDGIPVLMYHKIDPDPQTGGFGLRVPPASFDWEMHYLKQNGYHTVNLGDVVDHYQQGKPLPDKPIVVTFDDGYEDNYLYALPILKKYGFTATVFVVADTIGGINEFDYKIHAEPKVKMMNWTEIKAMDAAGITIGSHTLDHPWLTRVSPAEAKRQIAGAKTVLEKGLGKPVEYFCYPHGAYNDAIAKLVQESGYKAATTTNQGLAKAGDNPYELNRVRIMGMYTHQKFISVLHKY